jgi:uncharacterized protein
MEQKLVCPLCKSADFKKEEGKMDTKWGFFAHKVILMICNKCNFILQFSKGKTIWDFD